MKLTKLRKKIDKVVEKFIREYFRTPKKEELNFFSTSTQVYSYNDYYFDLETVVFCLENNVPTDKFFEWYDYCVYTDTVSLDFYLRGCKYTEKEIEEARLRVKEAEKTFKKELELLAQIEK